MSASLRCVVITGSDFTMFISVIVSLDPGCVFYSTDSYVEVLDGSRVHPETYEWARKMAVDALEYDDTAEDANPAGALEEILESPERLRDLDLDAFAEELERQVGEGTLGIIDSPKVTFMMHKKYAGVLFLAQIMYNEYNKIHF